MSAAINIPPTSRTRYLSGMAALNLPSPKGTGDWHMVGIFFQQNIRRSRSFIAGVGCPTDTTCLLADLGIFDCSEILDRLHIPYEGEIAYAANHARAIADLVLAAIMRGESPDFVRLDDWMPRDSDKQEVFDLLSIAIKQLSPGHQKQLLDWQSKNVESE